MKYTKIMAKIGAIVASYEHFEEQRICLFCENDCDVSKSEKCTNEIEKVAKRTYEKIKKEVEENGKI